ncbi:MAG: hypothetical protein Q9186_006713 [Xanthomendoza sp. 1 TL-2023]
MANTEDGTNVSIPIIFLKTPSVGHKDPYTTYFDCNPLSPSSSYEPFYVPVLEHTSNLTPIVTMLSCYHRSKGYQQNACESFPYAGLIFTSQRAVETFASALDSLLPNNMFDHDKTPLELLQHLAIPLYAVGPATARSLEGIRDKHMPCCRVRGGEEAGTGELLAALILRDYNTLCNGPGSACIRCEDGEKKRLLFLTGAKHRDVVPVTLRSAPDEQSIDVETMVVYATSESLSFASDIRNSLEATATAPVRWIVIFSPTSGESLLRALGWLKGDTKDGWRIQRLVDRRTYIASIGPTTRDYMKSTFGFDVDVCAEKPSPEGVRQGVEEFMRTEGLTP